MAAVLDCPKCGAPLNFEPDPGDETVTCSFCQETVIIPKDLRVPEPELVLPPQPARQQSNRWGWVIVGVIAAISLGVFVLGSIEDRASQQEISRAISAEIDATQTVSVLESATAEAEVQATDQAIQALLVKEQNWPVRLRDPFINNSHQWETGDVRDSYISGNRTIQDGTYTWKITAVQSTSDFSAPDMPDAQDFYASLDMKLVSMPDDPDADAGLTFRYNGSARTWYYFSINNQGQYYFGWYDGSTWSTLIPETDSAAIQVGATNHLSVGARGSQFIFVINGQTVDHFIDDHLQTGGVGVGINLPQADQKGTVQFSHFSVLAPAVKP